jgi:hypothetical protein
MSQKIERNIGRGEDRSRSQIAAKGVARFLLPYALTVVLVLILSALNWRSIDVRKPPNSQSTNDLVLIGAADNSLIKTQTFVWPVKKGPEFSHDFEPSLEERKPGTYRVRLGDVVSTNSDARMAYAMKAVMLSALGIDGYAITSSKQVGGALSPAQQQQKMAPPDVSQVNQSPSAAASPDSSASPSMAASYPGPDVEPGSKPSKAAGVKRSVEGLPGILLSQPPRKTSLTVPEIIVSATMMALLKADALGARAIVISFSRRDPYLISEAKWAPAIAEGLSRVWHHLGSVRVLYVEDVPVSTFPSNIIDAFESYFITPLPFPGGARFTQPRILDVEKLPSDSADLFNPAFSVTEPTTLMPAVVFFALSGLGYTLGRRRQTITGTWDDALGAGTISVVTLFVLLSLTRNLWRQTDSWIATMPGLLFIALVAVAMEI